MAYRKSNGKLQRRSRKIQPAVETLTFALPNGISYVDLNLAASIANRRAYKQEDSNWAVAGFTLYAQGTGNLAIWSLPDTWVCDNAYVKSKAMWEKMNDQVLDDEPDIQGKYHDFKVNMDSGMVAESIQCATNATGKILTPLSEDPGTGDIQLPSVGTNSLTTADFSAGAAPRADWNYSTIQIPNDPASGVTSEFSLHVVGPNCSIAGGDPVDSKGLITGYAKSRSRPQEQDPNVPLGDGWMNELFDVGENNEEIREDLVDDNDRPPYAMIGAGSVREAYPGGSEEQSGLHLHSSQSVSITTVGGKTSIRGGFFKLGLIKFYNPQNLQMLIQVHLVPGPKRGYMC